MFVQAVVPPFEFVTEVPFAEYAAEQTVPSAVYCSIFFLAVAVKVQVSFSAWPVPVANVTRTPLINGWGDPAVMATFALDEVVPLTSQLNVSVTPPVESIVTT